MNGLGPMFLKLEVYVFSENLIPQRVSDLNTIKIAVFSKDTGHEINFGMVMSQCLLQTNLRIVLISKCLVIRH